MTPDFLRDRALLSYNSTITDTTFHAVLSLVFFFFFVFTRFHFVFTLHKPVLKHINFYVIANKLGGCEIQILGLFGKVEVVLIIRARGMVCNIYLVGIKIDTR